MRDRLLLHGGIDHHPLQIFGLQRAGAMRHRKALLQQRTARSRGWSIWPGAKAWCAAPKLSAPGQARRDHGRARYTHAHQFNRTRRELKFLRTRLGRIIRDIRRKIEGNMRCFIG
jgi:hypothetical protein